MTTLVYDGDCAFCTSAIRLLERLHLTADVVIPYQHADLTTLGLTEQQCRDAVQWVGPEGTSSGHRAVARLLLSSALPWRPLGALLLIPPFSWLAAGLYRLIANNRSRLPGGTPACAVPPHDQP
jgi:predicted DCC family thiol-disulfide oxidoreductase YuxK